MDRHNKMPQSRINNSRQNGELSGKLNQDALLKLSAKMKLTEQNCGVEIGKKPAGILKTLIRGQSNEAHKPHCKLSKNENKPAEVIKFEETKQAQFYIAVQDVIEEESFLYTGESDRSPRLAKNPEAYHR